MIKINKLVSINSSYNTLSFDRTTVVKLLLFL